MIIDELNKKIADIESLANDKTSTIESKVSDLTEGLLMVADAVDIIPEMVDEKITAITKEFSTIKDTVSKVKAQKGDKGDRGEPGIDGIGIKGDDGKDGSPDTGEQIVDKINELEGVLDTKVLKDFSMPDVKDLERQINTIGNQTLRLLSRPTTTTSSSFTGVTTDATLTGLGTDASPLSVVATSASDVAVTVRAATTATLAGTWTYNNGTAGVGATLTRTTNGALPNQDGVSLSDGDRFLIKNQASTLANGVYVLTQKGVTSVSPTIFTRATDADETSELDELVVTVSEGSTNRGTVWGQQTNNPVVGTSAIVFATVVSTAVTQATSGTQAIYQIPTLTGTARQITRGTANFKYNPTNDLFTIRGIDYTFPANNGDASQVLTTDGSGTLSWASAGGGGSPGGSTTQIQYNNAGAFAGSSDFTWDNTNKTFITGDTSLATNKIVFTVDDNGKTVNIKKNSVDYFNIDFNTGINKTTLFNKTVEMKNVATSILLDATQIKFNNSYSFPFADGTSGQALVTDGSGNLSFATPTASASLTSTYVGYGDGSNVLTGSSDFIWNETNKILQVGDLANSYTGTTFKLNDNTASMLFNSNSDSSIFKVTLGSGNKDVIIADYNTNSYSIGNKTLFYLELPSGSQGFKIVDGSNTYGVGILGNTGNGTTTIGDVLNIQNSTKVIVNDSTQRITLTNVPTYADDSAATTAGLTTGQLYKTTTSGSTFLKIVP